MKVDKTISHDENSDQSPYNTNPHVNICNTFWRPSLTFHPYKHGSQTLVEFGSLWPEGEDLQVLVRDVFAQSALREAVIECAKLVLRCGPLRVLKELLRCRIIGLSQRFEPVGNTMLHIACIARNYEAVDFLVSLGISTRATDRLGRTADQICFCSRTKKSLQIRSSTPLNRPPTPASLQDKDTLFTWVKSGKNYDEIQIKLQSLEFSVNQEKNSTGDTLLHTAVRVGISQLALILSLVYIQYAEVEEYTRYGMTPLCIAAECGYSVISEVLICCLGANPNSVNPSNRWTPLHYAARNNKLDVVNVLIKRGADVNLESIDLIRADDYAKKYGHEDCVDAIVTKRIQRCELLSNRAENESHSSSLFQVEDDEGLDHLAQLKEHDLRESDLFLVDNKGRTLLMVAAEYNRVDNLRLLQQFEGCPINAQHPWTGRTSLSIAARNGNVRSVQVLLQSSADPSIKDIDGYLPLHYACKYNYHNVAQTILLYDTGLTGLEAALKYCNDPDMREFIKKSMHKRQKQIVNPALFECAANGNANRLYCTLEDGDDVNPITGAGDWPLMVAAENGHLEVIKMLYERGGDVSRRHPATNATVLHAACARGHLAVVNCLLYFCKRDGLLGPGKSDISFYQELDINAMNNSGLTALQMAAAKGFSKVVKSLLMKGASSSVLDANGLLYKCSEFEGVQVLIETHRKERAMKIMSLIRDRKGLFKLMKVWKPRFDHNLRDLKDDSPLMAACYYGRVDVVRFLVQSAIHRQVEDGNMDSNWIPENSDDSGAYVDNNSSTMVISRYLGTRTDVSSASEHSDTESTFMYNNPRRCKTPSGLLQSGEFNASGNFSMRNWFYRVSPMLKLPYSPGNSDTDEMAAVAAAARHQRAIDPKREFNRREQAFQEAVGPDSDLRKDEIYLTSFSEHNNPPYNLSAVLKRILNHICDYNSRDGCTALHRAVDCNNENKSLEIISLLLDKDRSCINIQDFSGMTPLHLACLQQKKQIVKFITDLEYVDINMRTLEGKLPEEMTTNKTIQKMVLHARELQPYKPLSLPTPPGSSVGGASIDFDRLTDRFNELLRSHDSF